MTRSNFVEARRMRVCYPSRPSARMVSCTFGLAPIRAMYALMFGHFARSILWILVQLSSHCRHHHSPTSATQPAGQDPEARRAPGTVTVPLYSRPNASPFLIMLLLVFGKLDNGMIRIWAAEYGNS